MQQTRWLSIGKCLPRLNESWQAFKAFFKEGKSAATTEGIKGKASDIYIFNSISSPTAKLNCFFLVDVIKVFDEFNTEMQSDSPKTHLIFGKLENLMRKLLIRYVSLQPCNVLLF